MSLFGETLKGESADYSAGGVAPKIEAVVIPKLEEMDDGSLEDFLSSLKNPSVPPTLLASTLRGIDITIGAGAIRNYRRNKYPEIFGSRATKELTAQ